MKQKLKETLKLTIWQSMLNSFYTGYVSRSFIAKNMYFIYLFGYDIHYQIWFLSKNEERFKSIHQTNQLLVQYGIYRLSSDNNLLLIEAYLQV